MGHPLLMVFQGKNLELNKGVSIAVFDYQPVRYGQYGRFKQHLYACLSTVKNN